MHGLINVKSPNNNSKWQMGFNSAFKELSNIPEEMNPWLDDTYVIKIVSDSLKSFGTKRSVLV
jgi:hypothetical protein